MKSPPPSAIEQTRTQALKEFRSLLHEALSSAVADEGVPDAFKDAIDWDKLIDQTEQRLVEVWRQRFDANGKFSPAKASGVLELLRDDEHEQQVLSEMFVNEVMSKDRERLDQLQQLLAAMGVEGWKNPSENPLGPGIWVDGVRSGMQQFRCTPHERSWLLQKLMPLLMARMGNFYGTLNSRISRISGVPLSSLPGRRAMAQASGDETFGHDLVENTRASRSSATDLEDDAEGGSDVLERLFSLMGARRAGGQMPPGMAPGMMPGMVPSGGGWGAPATGVGMPGAPSYGYPMPDGQYPMGQYPAMPGAGPGYDASGMPPGPSGPMPMWSDADLMSVLGMLQNTYAAPSLPVGASAGVSTARLFEAVSQTAGQMGLAGGVQSMPGPAQDMMELVNMLFEALLDGRRLDERARSQLSRLVIPYVRVALLDKRMFMQSRHPARRVLNQLVESLETASADAPQFRDLREIAFAAIERILSEFKDDISVFESLDKSLGEALSERRRGAEIAERRMADAERGRERRTIAMATVTAQLQQAIGGTNLPEPVRQFLTGPWQHHQTILVLREGIEGDQARSNLGLLVALAKACRQGGLVDLTSLRAPFEAVLASSGQPPEEVDTLLAELSSVIAVQSGNHTPVTLASEKPLPPSRPVSASKPATTSAAPVTHDDADVEAKLLAEIANFVADDDTIPKSSLAFDDDEEKEEEEEESVDLGEESLAEDAEEPPEPMPEIGAAAPTKGPLPQPEEESAAHSIPIALVAASANIEVDLVERYRALKVGDWLDLVNEDGRITAARISWTSPISGRHMLSNRRGQRLMVASVDELAAMELEGQVHIRSTDAAFDVALNALADRLARTVGAVSQ